MNIAFRVDAGKDLGTGHVMRCLALAETLRERGCAVLFLCRDLPGNLNEWIQRQKGFDVVVLDAAGPDAAQTAQCLQRRAPADGWHWLVIDHYHWDVEAEREVRPWARQLLVIDDLADRHHDCDVLLDQNYFRLPQARYAGRVPQGCELLLGPRYALLRPEFAMLRQQLVPREPLMRRLLVSFGGSDPTGETLKVLHALQALAGSGQLADASVEVILGASHADAAQVEALAATIPQVHCERQVTDMAERMRRADLFIGAGGTTTWERMALGLPGIVIAVADNQVAISESLAQDGYQVYLGASHQVSVAQIRAALAVMMSQPGLCRHMGERSLSLSDGLGCRRVAEHLLQAPATLRRATLDDSEAMFTWRNHADTRRFIFQPDPIAWEVHDRWFRESLGNANRYLLIGERNGEPLGVLRYDVDPLSEPVTAVVSVYRVPGTDYPSIGTALLEAGTRWLQMHVPQVQRIEAAILPGNVASVRAFEKAGYRLHHTVYEKAVDQKLLEEVPVSHEG